jgi:hypothetical protein
MILVKKVVSATLELDGSHLSEEGSDVDDSICIVELTCKVQLLTFNPKPQTNNVNMFPFVGIFLSNRDIGWSTLIPSRWSPSTHSHHHKFRFFVPSGWEDTISLTLFLEPQFASSHAISVLPNASNIYINPVRTQDKVFEAFLTLGGWHSQPKATVVAPDSDPEGWIRFTSSLRAYCQSLDLGIERANWKQITPTSECKEKTQKTQKNKKYVSSAIRWSSLMQTVESEDKTKSTLWLLALTLSDWVFSHRRGHQDDRRLFIIGCSGFVADPDPSALVQQVVLASVDKSVDFLFWTTRLKGTLNEPVLTASASAGNHGFIEPFPITAQSDQLDSSSSSSSSVAVTVSRRGAEVWLNAIVSQITIRPEGRFCTCECIESVRAAASYFRSDLSCGVTAWQACKGLWRNDPQSCPDHSTDRRRRQRQWETTKTATMFESREGVLTWSSSQNKKNKKIKKNKKKKKKQQTHKNTGALSVPESISSFCARGLGMMKTIRNSTLPLPLSASTAISLSSPLEIVEQSSFQITISVIVGTSHENLTSIVKLVVALMKQSYVYMRAIIQVTCCDTDNKSLMRQWHLTKESFTGRYGDRVIMTFDKKKTVFEIISKNTHGNLIAVVSSDKLI